MAEKEMIRKVVEKTESDISVTLGFSLEIAYIVTSQLFEGLDHRDKIQVIIGLLDHINENYKLEPEEV